MSPSKIVRPRAGPHCVRADSAGGCGAVRRQQGNDSADPGSRSADRLARTGGLVVVAGGTSIVGCCRCSVGSPNGTVTSAVSSRTIGSSPPHRWPTSASPGNAEPACASSELYALDVLDRFRPRTVGEPGPLPLGPRPARRRPRRRRSRASTWPTSTGAAASSTTWPPANASPISSASTASSPALLRSARTRPGCSLDEWWSERRCAREWGEVVRPDGYGVWTENTITTLPFLLEYDNGTERLARLAEKLDGYARLAAEAGHPNWVLFSFPGPRREADARRVLAHPDVPVATAARSPHPAPGFAPDAAVWLPGRRHGPRLRLAQLATLPIERRDHRPRRRRLLRTSPARSPPVPPGSSSSSPFSPPGAGAGITSLLGGGDVTPSVTATDDIPAAMLTLYQEAATTCPGLPWTVLAAIGTVESDNGQSTLPGVHSGANSAGAEVICGPGFPCRHVRDASDPRRASRLSTSCEPRTASVLAS